MDDGNNVTYNVFMDDDDCVNDDVDAKQSPHCDVRYTTRQENKERGNWPMNINCTLAIIGASVSVGNIVRFPFLLYSYGAEFLLVYVFSLFLVGLPLLYYELSLGQFSSNGILTCWPLPIFKGLGAAMLSYITPMCVYCNGIAAWFLYYLYLSARASATGQTPPWSDLPTVFEMSPACKSSGHLVSGLAAEVKWASGQCENIEGSKPLNGICWCPTSQNNQSGQGPTWQNSSDVLDYEMLEYFQDHKDVAQAAPPINTSLVLPGKPCGIYDLDVAKAAFVKDPTGYLSTFLKKLSTAKIFFDCHLLKKNLVPAGEPPELSSPTTLCFFLAWVLIFCAIFKGVKSISVMSMITVPIVLLGLCVLAIKAASLPGSGKWKEVIQSTISVHKRSHHMSAHAITHVVYSQGISMGFLITYASYNRFHNNFVRDVVVCTLTDFVMNMVGGTMILSFMAYYAELKGLPFHEVMNAGLSLSYVEMPTILATMSNACSWTGLYFLVCFLLMFNAMVSFVETFVTAFLDQFPRLRRFRPVVAGGLCGVLFLLGLPICTSEGFDWLLFLDWNLYVYQNILILLLMLACYITYGSMTYFWYRHDVAAMTGRDLYCVKSVVTWTLVTSLLCGPCTLLVIGLFGQRILFATISSLDFLDMKPSWASVGFENTIRVYPIVVLISVAVAQIIWTAWWHKRPFLELVTPWKPGLPRHENLVNKYRNWNPYSTSEYREDPASTQSTTQSTRSTRSTQPTGENKTTVAMSQLKNSSLA